jgi:hydroxypyruvate isomerase
MNRPLLLSAADWCFIKPEDDAVRYYQQLAKYGYTAAEMVPPERRAIARAAGLHLLNIAGAGNLNRATNRAKAVSEMRQQIAELSAEGIAQLIVFSGKRDGQDPSVGIANCIAALQDVAADAERANVMLTFEVFNTFDHPDYDADNSNFGFDVARGVSSPAVKVLYDLYHMHRMGEDVTAAVTANLEFVGHLHVAGSPKRDFPGDQQSLDYGKVVQQIHKAGYRGTWGMEFLPADAANVALELNRAANLFRNYSLG